MNFNNIINKGLLAGALILTAGALTSCEDFLTLDKPGVMTTTELNESKEAKEAMVDAAYAGLYAHFIGNNEAFAGPITNWVFDVRSDDAYKGGGDVSMEGNIHQLEIGNVQNDNATVFDKWLNNYYAISRCNLAIEAISTIDDGPDKDNYLAQLKTLRAYFYFDLYRVYDRFPYVVEGDDVTKVRADKYTRKQMYGMICQDLSDAYLALPEEQAKPGRWNKYAAAAILAKLAAFESDWSVVLEYTGYIKGSGKYELYPNFLDMSKVEFNNRYECIVTINHSTANNNANINWSNLLNTTWTPGVYYGADHGGDDFYIGSQNLVNAFRTDANGLPYLNNEKAGENVTVTQDYTVDPRVDFTFGRIGMPWRGIEYTQGWCRAYELYGEYSNKKCLLAPDSEYTLNDFPWGSNPLCFSLIRYADVLLLRAEAIVETDGNLEEARTLVNEVRKKAKRSVDPTYTPLDINPMKASYKVEEYPATGWDKNYARKAVRMERRLELAMEGNRWFDLVRWGEAVNTMNSYYQSEVKIRSYYDGAHLSEADLFFPIPQQQVLISGDLYKIKN